MAGKKVTPMMAQYLETKKEYKDCILFYRLGDFYEMFYEDALTASKELEITLTGKDCGLEERAPMCGVPHHSVNGYIAKLVEKGYKVAICEQIEDPKMAKGIVKRDVIRIVTPGTVIEDTMLDERNNNYLAVLYTNDSSTGMAFADITTGEMYATQMNTGDVVLNEIGRYNPSEIIMNENSSSVFKNNSNRIMTRPQLIADIMFDYNRCKNHVLEHFSKNSLDELNLENMPAAVSAVGMLLTYIEKTQKSSLAYINDLNCYGGKKYMDIDLSTRRNLEITENMRDKTKKGSLLWVLDKTKTSMGARLLKQWIEKPLVDENEINYRLDSVKELYEDIMLKDELGAVMAGIYDISRIIGRISLMTVSPKDFVALKQSLIKLPELEYVLSKAKSPLLSELSKDFDLLEDLRGLLEKAIVDENVPLNARDGGVIKDGYSNEVDKLRNAMTDGQKWLAALQNEERERTGIKNLKVGYNKVFGYYIEITKSNISDAPEDYIRKQTLANCERYITPKLKELENTILGASERVIALEVHLFEEIRKYSYERVERLKKAAQTAAVADVIYSLAETAYKGNYCMPKVTAGDSIIIKDGRHPVVEKMLTDTMFVPNDTSLDMEGRMIILTGPNMAGKSTYMRQTALISLMAQIGSFVPASSAHIGIVDKIFTRVGASDDISSGQSTFMLEMTEVSNILKHATKNSLIILDEIGRGTSTFDGLSIAWAVAEFVHKKIGAKTLFATHYHEMTQLEDMHTGVKNYRVAVKKRGDEITFLRKIVRGGADDSYGIEVAALAGVPKTVIKRAKEILSKIENGDMEKPDLKNNSAEEDTQLDFGYAVAMNIMKELKEIDVTTYTPIEALNKLFELTKKADEI